MSSWRKFTRSFLTILISVTQERAAENANLLVRVTSDRGLILFKLGKLYHDGEDFIDVTGAILCRFAFLYKFEATWQLREYSFTFVSSFVPIFLRIIIVLKYAMMVSVTADDLNISGDVHLYGMFRFLILCGWYGVPRDSRYFVLFHGDNFLKFPFATLFFFNFVEGLL